jgi:hypothetical protein
MADNSFDGIRPGVYNVDYFSGSQVGIYCGDILVDEVTAINFVVQQSRRPLYGYADQHFRAMSKGQVLVQGQFAINFKEAGYLWLVLNEYRQKIKGLKSKLDDNPFRAGGPISQAFQQNIEQLVNNESIEQEQRYSAIDTMAQAYASLSGFSSTTRAAGKPYDADTQTGGVGEAENYFEAFENAIWSDRAERNGLDLKNNRNVDDPDLNPFDIFIMYGDFAGDDRTNHTIVKLEDCYIVGSSQRIEIDPLPIQEVYSFFSRMRV